MQLKQLFSKNFYSILYLLVSTILPISVSSYLSIYIINNEKIIHQYGITEWAIIFIISTFTMALAITPTTFIALTCGYFLGVNCIPWLILSYTMASINGFSIAKNIGKDALKSTISDMPKLNIIVNGLKEHEYAIIFLTRISPILPFAFINGVLGILDCNIKKFIIAGTLGMLPRTLLFIYIGNEVGNMVEMYKSGKSMTSSQIIFYILLFISIIGMFWVFNKIAKKLKKSLTNI